MKETLNIFQLIGVFYKKPENKQSLDDLLECICAADTPLTVKERLLQGISCVPHEVSENVTVFRSLSKIMPKFD